MRVRAACSLLSVLTAVATGCGSKSGLSSLDDGVDAPSEAWTCAGDDQSCGDDGDCCSLQCNRGTGFCAPSPCQPGAPPTRVAAGPGRIVGWPALVASPHELFYAVEHSGIFRVSKHGGAAQPLVTIAPDEITASLTYADGAVWFTTLGPNAPQGDLRRVAVDDGSSLVLSTGQHRPNGIAVDDGHVYWTVGDSDLEPAADGKVLRIDRSANGSPSVIADDQDGPWAIAVRRGVVYFSNLPMQSGMDDGSIVRAAPDGSAVKTLVSTIGQAWFLAVDDEHVYFGSDFGSIGESSLLRARTENGARETLLSEKNDIGPIALDDRAVYVGIEEAGGFERCSVVRVPKSGGASSTLAETACVRGLVVDYSCVYWATEHEIWRAPRPSQ